MAEVAFELERFEWVGEDQLEVVGRWRGVSRRALARPVLTVETGGRHRRLPAVPGARAPAAEGELWKAVFGWSYGSADIDAAELEVARSIVVELPRPRTKRRVAGATSPSADLAERRLRERVESLEAELAALRSEAKSTPEPDLAAELAAVTAERDKLAAAAAETPGGAGPAGGAGREDDLVAARDEAAAARDEVASERDAAVAAHAEVVAERDRLAAELAGVVAERDRLASGDGDEESGDDREAVVAERDRLAAELAELKAQRERESDQQAALLAQNGALRGELGEAMDAHERLTAELRNARQEQLDGERAREGLASQLSQLRADLKAREEAVEQARREVAAAGEEAERRLAAERAVAADVRQKLADAREEAHRGLAVEADETERLRTELGNTREEAERALATERAETARLREELSDLTTQGDNPSTDSSGRRMYEAIAKELEKERATVRELRRELDSERAEATQKRRFTIGGSATNGVTTTDESPVASTPAGRNRAAALAARTEMAERATYRRADAARAAAAQRVPEHQQSPAGMWAVRAAALVLVAGLLVALFVIVTSVT
jgi:DNA repair exonuclease SbcCD ATPase subunit